MSIAAASIVAKVARDKLMREADRRVSGVRVFPEQGVRH